MRRVDRLAARRPDLALQPVRPATILAGIATEGDRLLFPDAVERIEIVGIVVLGIKKLRQEGGVRLSRRQRLEHREGVDVDGFAFLQARA